MVAIWRFRCRSFNLEATVSGGRIVWSELDVIESLPSRETDITL
jgi:hypothetical protein